MGFTLGLSKAVRTIIRATPEKGKPTWPGHAPQERPPWGKCEKDAKNCQVS
jgi:hypothetical protein